MSMTGSEENELLRKALSKGPLTDSDTYGTKVVSVKASTSTKRTGLVIGYDDFSRHIYLIGAWGTGKTSIIRLIAKALEEANKTGKFPNAFIYLDPKGDDSDKFLRQSGALDPDSLTYLDPDETGFSLNFLELPPHEPKDHERMVTVYTASFLSLIEEWYSSNPSNAPRMINIFEILLTYLYRKTNSPTPIDLYDLVIKIKEKDRAVMQDIEKNLKSDELRELQAALQDISKMEEEAFRPVLTRLSKFAISPYLRRLFSARHSTIDFQKLCQPGHSTIIRVTAQNIGSPLAKLIRSIIALNIWFAVQRRSSQTKEEDRTHVILAIDEFQDIKELDALRVILTQARSAKLCLVLAHQNSVQLDPDLFELLMQCAVQGAGRVTGGDAKKLAGSWDPQFSQEIVQTLTTQPDFTWTFRLRAQPGQEQPPPITRKILPPPPYLHSQLEVDQFKEVMRELYGDVQVAKSIFITREEDRWQDYLPKWIKEIPSYKEWKVLLALKENSSMSFYKITELLGMSRLKSREYSSFFFEMRDKGLIGIEARGGASHCSLGESGRKLVNPDFAKDELTKVVKSEDGEKIAQALVRYHQAKVRFIYPAVQRSGEGLIEAPDFLVYDYAAGQAFSVEIEAGTEVATHGEQVMQNLNKYYEKFAAIGLQRLEIWCHASQKEHVQYLVSEFLRDKEGFKDRIQIVCPEELAVSA